ncbi:hypothetical protein ASPNIDRAFT_124357, partial [Aspergillus niger ATCC 1015]
AAKEEELDQLSNPDKDCLAPVTNNRDKLGVPTEWFKRKRSRLLLRRRRLHVKRSIDRLKSVAILRFSCLLSAHLALQIAVFPRPSRMVTHIIDESTANHQTIYRCSIARNIRNVTVAVGLACLSLFWAVPIAMTGLLSQLVYLGSLGTFLSRFSDRQLSFVQGLLPQLALSALMYCFPSIIWWSAKLFHFYNDSSLHILVQRHYFCFLYVQVFLVVSVSSSLTTMIPDILRDIQSVPTILATNLPKASDYFYSYLLMQTVTQCVMALFQLPDSIWVIFAYKWRKHALKTVKWSLVYPVLTNLLCLCIIFSIISPLILVVGITMFGILWVVYAYQNLYVLEAAVETAGMLYWETLQQLFVGIYTLDLFLFGLFLLKGTLGPAVFAAIMLGLVAVVQYHLHSRSRPLVLYLS